MSDRTPRGGPGPGGKFEPAEANAAIVKAVDAQRHLANFIERMANPPYQFAVAAVDLHNAGREIRELLDQFAQDVRD